MSKYNIETFEKGSILLKVKTPACRAYGPEGKTKILTAGIHGVFRGLKFESDAEIGQKGVFFKGLRMFPNPFHIQAFS